MTFQIQDATGAPFSAALALSADQGTESAATAARVANTGLTTERVRLALYQIVDTVQVNSGEPALDGAWLQVRALGTGTGSSGQEATDWIGLGTRRFLVLNELAPTEYWDIEIRWAPTIVAQQGLADLRLLPEGLGPVTLPVESQAMLPGVVPFADFRLLRGGGAVLGGAVDEVDLEFMFFSIPGMRAEVLPAQTVTLSDLDGDSATLGAGEEYWFRLVIRDELVTTLKGSKSASLGAEDQPAVGGDDIQLVLGRRDETGVVAGSLVDERTLWRAELEVPTTSSVRISEAEYIVNGRYVYATEITSSPGNGSWTAWATSGGTQVAASAPEDGAMPLWAFDVAGGVVDETTIRDKRKYWTKCQRVTLGVSGQTTDAQVLRELVSFDGSILPETFAVSAGVVPAGDSVDFEIRVDGALIQTLTLADGAVRSSDADRRAAGSAAPEPTSVALDRESEVTVTVAHGGSIVTPPSDVVVSLVAI